MEEGRGLVSRDFEMFPEARLSESTHAWEKEGSRGRVYFDRSVW